MLAASLPQSDFHLPSLLLQSSHIGVPQISAEVPRAKFDQKWDVCCVPFFRGRDVTSIDSFATKSAARQYCSAGFITGSRRFQPPQASLSRRPCSHPESEMCPSTSSLPQRPRDRAVFARNRRLGFTCVQLSLLPSRAVFGSGGIEDALVPADDDPPARSVSPASAIVGASSVTFGGPPRRTNPCPSHGNPFASFSKETSVRWFGGGLRIVLAICRPVSVVCTRRLCPNRCHPCRSFCFGSCVWCEAIGYGVGRVHQTGGCPRCRTHLDTAWLPDLEYTHTT